MFRRGVGLFAVLSMLAAVPAAAQVVPDAVGHTPVLGAETAVGSIVTSAIAAVPPTPKVVDGDPSDWTGQPTRLGGTALYSHGELVYQDFVNDAWGADDGYDAGRMEVLGPAKETEPRTYRLDALQQAAGAQFGADRPVGSSLNYGDADAPDALRTQADIHEMRLAADADKLYLLVRTLRMDDPPATAVLLLVDTEPGGSYELPRSAGGLTTGAEWAFLTSGERMLAVHHRGVPVVGVCEPCPESPYEVASDPSGYVNTLELSVDRDLFASLGPSLRVGVATGVVDDPSSPTGLAEVARGDAASDLVNVAFRREPARIWMDQAQAFALRDADIDDFLHSLDVGALEGGRTESFVQRPGYYERIYVDDETPVNREEVQNSYFQGPVQHYGLYLPEVYRPEATLPASFWMHYRGGHAHDAAAWVPGVLRNFGDDIGAIVVTPSARGTSSWYTGRGMVDFLDVWDDVMAHYAIDRDRVYLGGHSMGGWASWLLGLLMPDRWAASNPQDGLLAPGLWLGMGEPTSPQQDADLEAEFLYHILENARNLPYAILHGTADELVPVTGAIAAGARLHELGYRYRLYLYHAYEHFSAPIWDDWREVVSYMTTFTRDRDPARVTYKVWPALDHAVSTISVPTGVDLGLRFDSAYWVSGLRTRTPGIDPGNLGKIDAVTHGRGVPEVIRLPEAGAGGITPYTMTGQRWLPNGRSEAFNGFTADLENLSTATLDVARMGLGTSSPMTVEVSTDGPAELRLRGTWAARPPWRAGRPRPTTARCSPSSSRARGTIR